MFCFLRHRRSHCNKLDLSFKFHQKCNCRGKGLVKELLSIALKTMLGSNVLVLIKKRSRPCNLWHSLLVPRGYQRPASVSRKITLCGCLDLVEAADASIHIFCWSMNHTLMDETAIISMHVCSHPLQQGNRALPVSLSRTHASHLFTSQTLSFLLLMDPMPLFLRCC